MKMRDIVAIAELFRLARKDKDLAISFSDKPWRPDTQWHGHLQYEDQKGIYVFCGEGPDVPASVSDADVWYVGMTDGAGDTTIRGRVFAHFGRIGHHPETGAALDDRPHHRWHEIVGIPEHYRTAIEQRKCLIYTAAVSASPADAPPDLEQFILRTIYLFNQIKDGTPRLPPLNTRLP